jgi:hypothetical protein
MASALDEGSVMVTVLSLLLIAICALGQTALTTNLSGRFDIVLIEILAGAMLADARFRDTIAYAMKLTLPRLRLAAT